jgi:arginase
MQKKSYEIIGAELGWGAQNHLTQQGPNALQAFGIEKSLSQINPTLKWRQTLRSPILYSPGMELNYAQRLQQVHSLVQQLGNVVKQSILEHHYPLVLGGDHAMAIGTWSGAVSALDAQQSFGLIWVDAHMDSHTPQTTPSQAIHGMPLAALMGYGDSALTHLLDNSPKLDPRHVVLIGVRSFEPGEAELLKRLNVTIFYMEDVNKMGIQAVFDQALKIVTNGTKAFGVSVDLDAFDPTIAPGVGTPEKEGLSDMEVLEAIHRLSHHPLFCALEIAELNPSRDIDNKTLALSQRILEGVVRDE